MIVCLWLLTACGMPEAEEKSAGTLPTQQTVMVPTEPAWNGELSVELPEGYSLSRNERGEQFYFDGMRFVGGMKVYAVPEGYGVSDYFKGDFLRDMGLEEAAESSLGCSGGGSPSGMGPWGWSAEYFSNVPNWEDRTIHTAHQFFVMSDEKTILDFWIDLMYVDYAVGNQIFASIEIPEIERYRQEAVTEPTVSMEVAYELLELPEGYSCDMLDPRCILFFDGNKPVGGMDVFTLPEGVYDPEDHQWVWLETLGRGDFKSMGLQYLGGAEADDGSWMAEFVSEEPEGQPGHIRRRHVYRVIGKELYDIWLELTLLTEWEMETLLNVIQFKEP
jgi:hypothetical protein